MSHVCFETGAVIDVQWVLDQLWQHHEYLVTIIDGAQAVGNVNVSSSILNVCHFYATSGHKWLLGKDSLGILIHNPSQLKRAGIEVDHVAEADRPFSSAALARPGSYTQESVSLEPMVSLNAMLCDLTAVGSGAIASHNLALATRFVERVHRLSGVSVVNMPAASGIVTLRISGASEVRERLEETDGAVCQAFGQDLLRVCFHYYMSEDDVFWLAESLERSLEGITRESVGGTVGNSVV